tara:strand:+ start:19346 stop:19714 length:369 start_codon:yes stop_codon:yes gene_type:complete
MRYSSQREIIKNIIFSTNTHPTASWIYNRAKKSIPRISLGTVYRNLSQLTQAGIVTIINDHGVARYDWNQEPHFHLKCHVCGDLIDVEPFGPDIRKIVKEKYNFRVNDLELKIIGECKKHTK